MRRLIAIIPLLAGAVAAMGAAGVFAGSKPVTYTNHAIAASAYIGNGDHAAKPGQVGTWEWLSYRQSASWTFDATQLATAINGTVKINITGLSTNQLLGSGYSTTLKVAIAGTGIARSTATLTNPWRPHIAHNATPGIGWQAYATLNVPKYVYAGAHSLRVDVVPSTPANLVGVNQTAILIGYGTTP
jgi:hypothetical protein